jgi:DNA-binding NtrC family response regulator/tetratricopeptide (TPR) repeat protein
MNPLAELIGESQGVVAVREQIRRLVVRRPEGQALPPILIQGETGTGKGILARTIHGAGPRSSGPFIAVNCAAIPETLLEAEMFGFERGAFTDARQAKAGLFQAANRGTIFLDEVGLLPEALQAKLLKAIEEREVRRLGSTRTEPIDVWIVTATSDDLASLSRQRRFREALYHRLSVLTFWLPPLRERGRDVLVLARHFLARACAEYSVAPKSLTKDAEEALLAYSWLGNVRELANVIERVALLVGGSAVTAEALALPATLPRESAGQALRGPGAQLPAGRGDGPDDGQHLLAALEHAGWNVSRAAALLGITRNTLRYRMERLAIRPRTPPRESSPARQAAPIAPPPPPARRSGSAARWERQSVTVLLALLSSEGDPTAAAGEPAVDVDEVAEKVQGFGGRIEELGPTGILASFGVEPVEEAPVRAALCALALRGAVERVRAGAARPTALRAGIHTQAALVGRHLGAAAIDLRAKREASRVVEALVDQAEAGSILVSQGAAPLLRRRFRVSRIEAGRINGVQAFQLLGAEAPGMGPSGLLSAFVGRDEEMSLLESRVSQAVQGRGQVIGIVGEPGIGKSRLVHELRARLATQPVAFLQARCLSYATDVPYLALLGLFREHLGIAESDAPDDVQGKVRTALADVGLESQEGMAAVLHLLGGGEGAGPLARMSPETVKARTQQTLLDLVTRASARRPIALVIEDLHWADRSSDEWLALLVDRAARAPVVVIATYRPGYRPSWAERSHVTQVALAPLTAGQSLSLVRSVLRVQEVTTSLADEILARAEGNPLFLEELALAVGELGPGALATHVPDSIQGVLGARIERLEAEPRRVLQVASVLGRSFPLDLLRALCTESVDQHLLELKRLEFLQEHSGEDEVGLIFRHALTWQVAYESLPSPDRTALHGLAAETIESQHMGRLDAVHDRLAYHYERSDRAEKAVTYLTLLAQRAQQRFAHVEAAATLDRALARAEQLPAAARDRQIVELTLLRAFSLALLARFRENLELLASQQERVSRLGDPRLAGAFHFRLGLTHSVLSDQREAARLARRALEEAREAGDELVLGQACYLLALADYYASRHREGVEHAREAAAILERVEGRHWLGLASWVLGANLLILGELDMAWEAERRVEAIGDALDDPRLRGFARWSMGWIHLMRGEGEAAVRSCEQAIAVSRDPLNTAVATGHLGWALLARGDADRALALFDEAIPRAVAFGLRHLGARFMALRAEALHSKGDVEPARREASEALAVAREVGYPFAEGLSLRAMGASTVAGGQAEEGRRLLQEAEETFRAIGASLELAQTQRALARLGAGTPAGGR